MNTKRLIAVAALAGFLVLADSAFAQRYGRGGRGYGYRRSGPTFSFSIGRGGYYGRNYGYYDRGYYPFFGRGYGYGYTYPRYYSGGYISEPSYYVEPSRVIVREPEPIPVETPLHPDQGRLRVIVPDPDARVLLQGQPTSNLGQVRLFDSPPLEPGRTYAYNVEATWRQGDRDVTESRRVIIRAGAIVDVDFTRPERVPTPPPPGSGPRL